MAESLRDALPGLRLLVDAGPGNFKRKMRSADRSEAELALILGEDEIREQKVSCKDMRGDGGQQAVARSSLADALKARFDFDD